MIGTGFVMYYQQCSSIYMQVMKANTRKISRIWLVTLVMVLIVAAYSCSSSTSSSNPPANTVQMSGSSFINASLTVTKGTSVTFTNNDSRTHTATSDVGTWDTGDITAGSSKTITFSTAGTFPYHCIYHVSMGMKGTIIVQ